MAINSSSSLRFPKPAFLQNRHEKIQSRIDKFLKACALEDLLKNPKQKICCAKLMMDQWNKVISTDDLIQVFGKQKAEKLTDTLNQALKKLTPEDRPDFMEALEIHLVSEVLGKQEANHFYLHLNTSLSFSAEGRIQALEEKFQSLQPQAPALHQHHASATPLPGQATGSLPLSSTPPNFSASNRSSQSDRPPARSLKQNPEPDDDSWAACDARSTASTQQDDPSIIYYQTPSPPLSFTLASAPLPSQAPHENEKS